MASCDASAVIQCSAMLMPHGSIPGLHPEVSAHAGMAPAHTEDSSWIGLGVDCSIKTLLGESISLALSHSLSWKK